MSQAFCHEMLQPCCRVLIFFFFWFLYLLDKYADNLEWHKRHAIAIGIAKGLRFLHEECRGGPIIHRDLRPSNILLTHDFVPMVKFMNDAYFYPTYLYERKFYV